MRFGILILLMFVLIGVEPDICALAASTQGTPAATFKELTELLSDVGEASTLSVAFCERFSISCGGKPFAVKYRRGDSDAEHRVISIGADSSGQTVVIIFRQDTNKATGELYACDPSGNLARAYHMINNGTPVSLTPDAAKSGFDAQKKWWMDWLPTHGAS